MTGKTIWAIGIIGIIVLVALYGVIFLGGDINGNVTRIDGSRPIKIGFSLPLTGEAASLGEGALGAIELALKEANDAGGINGRKIEAVIEDDQCNSRGGINSLTKLATVDKVTAIIGPLCSAAAGPGLPVVQSNGVPTIIWASAPHLTIDKDYVFRTYPSDAFQGIFSANYIYNDLGKRRVAVVYVQNDWGQGIRDVFVKEFQELGGEVVFDEGVAQEAKDMRSVITKIDESSPDMIYFPAYPSIGVVGLKQMKEQGINVPILGGDAFEADEVIKSGYAEGVMYTIGSLNSPDEFQQKIKAVSDEPINLVTPIAYDSINILVEIMREVGTDQEKIKDALKDYRTTNAVSLPVIEFDENGDLASAEFDVKVINNGQTRVIN